MNLLNHDILPSICLPLMQPTSLVPVVIKLVTVNASLSNYYCLRDYLEYPKDQN